MPLSAVHATRRVLDATDPYGRLFTELGWLAVFR
jgi:hypothetical protein